MTQLKRWLALAGCLVALCLVISRLEPKPLVEYSDTRFSKEPGSGQVESWRRNVRARTLDIHGWLWNTAENRAFDRVLIVEPIGSVVLASSELEVRSVDDGKGHVEFSVATRMARTDLCALARRFAIYGWSKQTNTAYAIAGGDVDSLLDEGMARLNFEQLSLLVFVCLAPFIVLAPGFLLLSAVPAWRRRLGSSGRWWCLAFPVSLFFYLGIYLLLTIGIEGISDSLLPDLVYTAVFTALVVAVIAVNRRYLRRIKIAAFGARKGRGPLSSMILVMLCGYAYVILPVANPLEDFEYHSVNGQLKGADLAHDNTFQYYNARAIALHEPFEKYYGGAKLIYQVYDREMGAGLVLSVIWRVLQGVSPRFASSYVVYTCLGMAMNISVIIPLLFISTTLVGRRKARAMALSPLITVFGFVNCLFTWFKFAGAAMTLSGIYLGATSKKPGRDAWLVGMAWGCAVNLHASTALFFPFIIVADLLGKCRARLVDRGKFLINYVIVTGMVACLTAPWSVVKKFYLSERYILIREFMFASDGAPGHNDSMGAIAKAFFSHHPLSEQVPRRLHQVISMVRPELWFTVLKKFSAEGAHSGLLYLIYCENEYLTFVCAPFLSLAFVAWWYARRHSKAVIVSSEWRRSVMLLTVGSVGLVGVVFAAYPNYAPDLPYATPMAATLLVILGSLALVELSQSRIAKRGLKVYLWLAFGRLVAIYFA